jgi:hypothetical protein
MKNHSQDNRTIPDMLLHSMMHSAEWGPKMFEASLNKAETQQIYWKGILGSLNEFMIPSLGAMNAFFGVEQAKLLQEQPQDTYRDNLDLLHFNIEIGVKGFVNSLMAITNYHLSKVPDALQSSLLTLFGGEGEELASYTARQHRLFDLAVNVYPQAIEDIKSRRRAIYIASPIKESPPTFGS